MILFRFLYLLCVIGFALSACEIYVGAILVMFEGKVGLLVCGMASLAGSWGYSVLGRQLFRFGEIAPHFFEMADEKTTAFPPASFEEEPPTALLEELRRMEDDLRRLRLHQREAGLDVWAVLETRRRLDQLVRSHPKLERYRDWELV